jgi:uncharacterized cupredoxin-like copper-binding protein
MVGAALLMLLAGCAQAASTPEPTQAPTQAPPQQVNVKLTDFGIESSISEFEAGKTYEFVIVNEGQLPHSFAISPPHTDDEHMEMDEEEHEEAALMEVKEDQLQAGDSVTVEYTFPESAADEELEFACHVAGHYEQDMKLPITVN